MQTKDRDIRKKKNSDLNIGKKHGSWGRGALSASRAADAEGT
jgi:hypothetical protein